MWYLSSRSIPVCVCVCVCARTRVFGVCCVCVCVCVCVCCTHDVLDLSVGRQVDSVAQLHVSVRLEAEEARRRVVPDQLKRDLVERLLQHASSLLSGPAFSHTMSAFLQSLVFSRDRCSEFVPKPATDGATYPGVGVLRAHRDERVSGALRLRDALRVGPLGEARRVLVALHLHLDARLVAAVARVDAAQISGDRAELWVKEKRTV